MYSLKVTAFAAFAVCNRRDIKTKPPEQKHPGAIGGWRVVKLALWLLPLAGARPWGPL